MKHLRFVGFLAILFLVGGASSVWAEPNSLTPEEKQAGFALLFNGKDFEGWKQSGNWVIDDGAFFRQERGGSLVYSVSKVPDDFELRFEWKVGPASNSGIYYRPGQYEYQILDNQRHGNGTNPRTTAASIYFCMAPSHDATKSVGEWNTGRIVCKGTVIQHWLNGEKVIDFDYTDPKYKANVELLAKRGGDLAARGASLSLQDHNDPVWFRSLRWRKLEAKDGIHHTEVIPADIPASARAYEKKRIEDIQKRQQQQQQTK